jgi:ATP-binding cassette subfamily F protein 3
MDAAATPFIAMGRLMPKAPPGEVRARLGRFGFSQDKADVKIADLSGGERARLNFAFITFDAPALLVLDEPTNHLDIQAREALVEALNDYGGAVVLISHDRHLIELTADRLWLVAGGRVSQFDGDLDDYQRQTLSQRRAPASSDHEARPAAAPRPAAPPPPPATERKASAGRRQALEPLRRRARAAEAEMNRLAAEQSHLDTALAAPETYGDVARAAELTRKRGYVAAQLAAAEASWLQAQQALEEASAA